MENALFFAILVSMVTAIALGFRALLEARQEQQASDLRVAALSAEIFEVDSQPSLPNGEIASGHTRAVDLFSESIVPSKVSRQGFFLIAAGTLVLILAVSVMFGATRRGSAAVTSRTADGMTTTGIGRPAGAADRSPGGSTPVELIGLAHSQEAERLTVYGILRNPPAGPALSSVAIIVMFFNDKGGYAGSGRAMIDALAPGVEKPFVVAVPAAGSIGRYRVSVQTEDRVIPHIDRRS